MSRTKTQEEIYIDRIENGIRGIKMRTKSPEQVDLADTFQKLKGKNKGMYDDLLSKYENVLRNYENKR